MSSPAVRRHPVRSANATERLADSRVREIRSRALPVGIRNEWGRFGLGDEASLVWHGVSGSAVGPRPDARGYRELPVDSEAAHAIHAHQVQDTRGRPHSHCTTHVRGCHATVESCAHHFGYHRSTSTLNAWGRKECCRCPTRGRSPLDTRGGDRNGRRNRRVMHVNADEARRPC